MHCSFCQIASGAKEADRVVHREDGFVVFQPITEASNKLLIVPVRHAESLADLQMQDLAAWMDLARQMAEQVRAKSYRMQINVKNQHQNVRHLYMQFSYQR